MARMTEQESRDARAAIRHALQFLEDPTHRGDGHLGECIAACRDVLLTDRPEPQPAPAEERKLAEQQAMTRYARICHICRALNYADERGSSQCLCPTGEVSNAAPAEEPEERTLAERISDAIWEGDAESREADARIIERVLAEDRMGRLLEESAAIVKPVIERETGGPKAVQKLAERIYEATRIWTVREAVIGATQLVLADWQGERAEAHRELRAALKIYADEKNWKRSRPDGPVDEWVHLHADKWNGPDLARAALSRVAELEGK